MTNSALLNAVKRRLDSEGIDWEALRRNCEQILVFGSFGAGVATKDSDLDLLCVGTGKSRRSKHLDLIFQTSKFVKSSRWIHSELGTHVAMYGVCLHGETSPQQRSKPGLHAVENKREWIRCRAAGLHRLWASLMPAYRKKHAMMLRRDLQRLLLLKKEIPVPPSAALDAKWVSYGAVGKRLEGLLRELNESALLTVDQMRIVEEGLRIRVDV